jgi:hypothetical protein
MKTAFELSPENYDGLLSKVTERSLAYSILKNGIVNYRSEEGTECRVIDILCDPAEAEVVLRIAGEVWPKAADEIKDSIIMPNPVPSRHK